MGLFNFYKDEMKNVIITGASKGIGFATAIEFAKAGHKVLAIARDFELLKRLQSMPEAKGNINILALDLLKEYNINDLLTSFQHVDILINNAGTLVNKPFEQISKTEIEHVYQLNVFAPFILTQKLMPFFSATAHIINIGSVGGVNGTQKFPGLTAYSSSKSAISCLSECLQAEFDDSGLTFNSLALGAVQTEMLSEAFPGYQAPVTAPKMAEYVMNFALTAPAVIRGKTISVSRTTP